MQVRRFEATSMKDALSAVKKELGVNAVILSTKEIAPADKGGIKLFEVTAAASVSSTKAGAESRGAPVTNDYSFNAELQAKLADIAENSPTRSQVRLLEGAMHDIKSLLIESLRATSVNTSPGEAGHLFPIERELSAAGVDPSMVSDLLRHLHTLPGPAEIIRATGDNIDGYYRDQAIRWMIKRIKIAPKWTSAAGLTSVHVMLGTPGCGKTTLITKLASAIQKKERHKVAVVSCSQDKLAGSEQLRVYSKILGVPHHVISAPHELKKIVLSMKGVDLVLVDTPGKNPNDSTAIADPEVMKGLGLNLDFHLVLSAAEKYQLSERAISQYSSLGLSSFSVSKLDESPSYGEVFNATARWSLPVSYFSFSAAPSDALERATRERILERIFNI